MRRLLTLLILCALSLGQGFSVAAAVCQHGSVRAHELARVSSDSKVAAAAHVEETAASVVDKKGALSGGLTSITTAVLPSPVMAELRRQSSQTLPWSTGYGPELGRRDSEPLLRPPLA